MISVVGTVVGTLLISIILGFLGGRIGLGPVVGIVALLLLLAILVLLFLRWGPKRAGMTTGAMVVVGSVIFLGSALIGILPERNSPSAGGTAAQIPETGEGPGETAATPGAGYRVQDDFNDNTFNNGYNPALWKLINSDGVLVDQRDGALVVDTTSPAGQRSFELSPLQPDSWPAGSFRVLETKMMLDSAKKGRGGQLKIQAVLPKKDGDNWWVECQLRNTAVDHTEYFCNLYSGGPWVWPEGYEYYTSTVSGVYDTWLTARVEFSPEMGQFVFFLDGKMIGLHIVRDKQDWTTGVFYPFLGAWVEEGEDLRGYFDDVRIRE